MGEIVSWWMSLAHYTSCPGCKPSMLQAGWFKPWQRGAQHNLSGEQSGLKNPRLSNLQHCNYSVHSFLYKGLQQKIVHNSAYSESTRILTDKGLSKETRLWPARENSELLQMGFPYLIIWENIFNIFLCENGLQNNVSFLLIYNR